MPQNWITTPLQTGPIAQNNYDSTITSLSASTLYEYRAYMVVNGLPYYGETCCIITLPQPQAIPSVFTGIATCVGDCNMQIIDSNVINKNNLAITEYGVLYTQNQTYGTAANLIVGNSPTYVSKTSIIGDIETTDTYFSVGCCPLTGLSPNVLTYYRAFAKNDCGYGYGNISTQQTEPSTDVMVYLASGAVLNCTTTMVCACAKIVIAPPLTSGQSFRLCFTDSATSASENGTHAMCACSYLQINSTMCNCVKSSIPDNIGLNSLSDSEVVTKYVDIDSTTDLNNYTFYTVVRNKSADINCDYTNKSIITFENLVNQVGGNYMFGDPYNQSMCVDSASFAYSGVANVNIPTTII